MSARARRPRLAALPATGVRFRLGGGKRTPVGAGRPGAVSGVPFRLGCG